MSYNKQPNRQTMNVSPKSVTRGTFDLGNTGVESSFQIRHVRLDTRVKWVKTKGFHSLKD